MTDVTAIFKSFSEIKTEYISLSEVIVALILAIICIISIKSILKMTARILEKSHIQKNLHTFIKTSVKILLYFVAVLIVVDSLGIPITSLVAVLGIFGLAVSLAVQGLLSNLASGMTILITKPFVIGNFVEIGDIKGIATDIDFVYTIIKTVDNKIISVPNSQVAAAKIINYSVEKKRRVELKISAPYEANIDKVKNTILSVINENKFILKNEEILVRVMEYKESSVEYVVRVWANNSQYWDVYFDLMEDIKRAFDEDNISMPFNQLDVHLIK